MSDAIKNALEKFEQVLIEQQQRVQQMKEQKDFVDYKALDKIIIGALMALVPGIAITNAMRDIMAGDMVSGISKGAEALLIGAAIALGTAIALGLAALTAGG